MSFSEHEATSFQLYARKVQDEPLHQIFVTAEYLGAEVVELILAAVEPKVEEEGVYFIDFQRHADATQVELEKVAESDQAIALVYATKSDEGDVDVEDAMIEPLQAALDENVMEVLASAVANQLDSMQDGVSAWIFLTL